MKNKRIIPLIIFTFLFSFVGNAQLKKANKLYNYFNYSEAIPYYLKVVESNNSQEQKEATQRLADCYRLTNNVVEAGKWYQKVLQTDGADPINYFYLGQALRSLEEYDKAAQAFKIFNTLLPDSLEGEKYYRFCADIKKWLDLPEMAEIKNVESLNSRYSDFGPAFYKNGVVFTSDRQLDVLDKNIYGWTNFNYLDLYFSKPEYSGNFWSAMAKPSSMAHNFNQSYHDGPASFSSDGKTVYVTKTETKDGKREGRKMQTYLLKIFSANIEKGKKLRYTPFFLNSDQYSVAHPTLSSDNSKIIFSSDMPGGFGGSDLYQCTWEDGKWSDPVNLGDSVNTTDDEVFPYLANDSVLFFSSNGHLGFGGLDIYKTDLTIDGWSGPENLKKPLNSSYDDFGIILKENMKEGLFSSNRPGGKGSDDIYAFRNMESDKSLEAKELARKLMVHGFVKDMGTMKPLEKATVFILNSSNDEVLILKTDENGYYETLVDHDIPFVAKAMKNGYIHDCTAFRTPAGMEVKKFKVPRDLLLGKIKINQVFKVENIYYDLDKWFIREDAQPPLDNLVQIMKQYPISVELSSHTDSRASFEYNMELSQKRAEAAVRYIVLQGVNPARISAKGYGETQLVNQCADGVPCTEKEHQANRRTEFKITAINGDLASQESFNPDIFQHGDKISAKTFGANFFDKCLNNKLKVRFPKPVSYQPTPSAKEVKKVAPTSRPAAMIIKPVVTPVQKGNYRIQIFVTSKEFDVNKKYPQIADLVEKQGLSVVQVGTLKKYQLGNFKTKAEANDFKNLLRKKGVKDCFVVKIN